MAAEDPTPISSKGDVPAGGRPRFGSLRARLIASHSAVLILALGLVLLIGAGFLRREEERAGVEHLRDLAVPLLVEARLLPGRGLVPSDRRFVAEALAAQAAAVGVRLLVFDPDGTVRFDTGSARPGDGDLTGRRLDAYAGAIAAVREKARRDGGIRRSLAAPPAEAAVDPLGGDRLVVAADARSPGTVLGIAAPSRRRPLLRRFVGGLLVASIASLAVASVAAWWLSRRLAAPVGRLAAAADAMATGALEQRVAGEGPDEIGRLVVSFNAMSRRVAATARSQRDLLANVAHELRTPLTSVRGYAQALRDGVAAAPGDRERALATIGDEAERMGRLVEELLDLARLESGQVRLRLETVAVAPALARVAARFAPEATARGVALTTGAPPTLHVRADEGRLAQVLGNLVDNALRHTPRGGSVAVAAAPLAATAARGRVAPPIVRLTVRDNGVGIPPERLDRIFERFERGNGRGPPPDAVGPHGYGLGLAIVGELVAAHGGTIAVESEIGVGTTLAVDLPAGG